MNTGIMEGGIFIIIFAVLLKGNLAFMGDFDLNKEYPTNDLNETSSNYDIYSYGVHKGIINQEEYPYDTFLKDEINIFKDMYEEQITRNETELPYAEWLVFNNFGLLSDSQQSIFGRKIVKRSTADNKRRFINTVKTGDILVTSSNGIGGFVGHAAIMTSNYWVLEMPGGVGAKDNNRQIGKDAWFDNHAKDWTTVYRCPDNSVAKAAARWADRTYYSPSGGTKKVIHIDYGITPNFKSKNPSYCSKLVIQAYYFGTGSKSVIKEFGGIGIIVPTAIPNFFLSPYKLQNKGRF